MKIHSKLAFLGFAVVVISAVAGLTVNFIRSKIKETSRVLGVGTLYGAIFAALFLAPFPPNQTIGQSSSDCSIIRYVITPGYGSDHDNGGFSGYICYEDYDDFLKCLRMVENNYQNALVTAWNDKETCAKNCTFTAVAGGIGCFVLGVFTVGFGGALCYWGAGGAGALCLSICRNNYSNDIDNAECDADTGVENCLIAHGATDDQINAGPYDPGIFENPINLPR